MTASIEVAPAPHVLPDVRQRFHSNEIVSPVSGHSIEVFTSDDPEIGAVVRSAAQKLHARVYLNAGYVSPDELVDGVYPDTYSDQSTYYYAKNGTKDVVARQIGAEGSNLASLPTFQNFSCDADKVKEVAGISSFAELKANQVVEISALSAEKKGRNETSEANVFQDRLEAVPFLYASMLRDSVEKGHRLWISNMEQPLIDVISSMVGPGQLHQVGEPKTYMGPATTPIAINPLKIIESILSSDVPHMETYQEYIKTTFKGVNVDNVPKDFARMLRGNNIETTKSSLAKRLAKSKEFLAQLAIFSYSAARVVPAATVDEFEGSMATLLAIDLGTAVPYTHGMMKMYTGKSVREKVYGAAIAVPSFLAPYAYYYAEGEDYPAEINMVAGGLVAGAIITEIGKRRKAKKTDITTTETLEAIKS